MKSLDQEESRDFLDYKKINDNELLYLVAENNDEYANVIYKKYKPIVLAIAKKYSALICDRYMDYDDLVQCGFLGLYYAIRCFKDKGFLFYTYACLCIRKAIEKEVYNKNKKRMKYNYIAYNENNYHEYDIYHDNNLFVSIKNILKPIDSYVFELRINGFSYEEISFLLDLNKRQVDYSLQKIRKKIKTLLLNESFVL